MAISQKYGRTYHYPFSPGTTSDDRIQHDYWEHLQHIPTVIHTEKLDGENNCLNQYGVFARSHAAPTTSPWTESLRRFWQLVKHDLGSLEIFLENLYAVHSIEYRNLENHFYVFAIREHERWLSWEETEFYAGMLGLPTVPVIGTMTTPVNRSTFEQQIQTMASGTGLLQPYDAFSGEPATMEGIVTRNTEAYATSISLKICLSMYAKGMSKPMSTGRGIGAGLN